jgi:hypothetical protein
MDEDKLREAIETAIADLTNEHYPDPQRVGTPARQVCVTCTPQDGSWPCITMLTVADLKEAIASTDK